MKIEITSRYYLSLIRWAKIEKSDNFVQAVGKQTLSSGLFWVQIDVAWRRASWQHLLTLNMHLPFDLAPSSPGNLFYRCTAMGRKWWMYKVICCSIICDSKSWETTQVFTIEDWLNWLGTSLYAEWNTPQLIHFSVF